MNHHDLLDRLARCHGIQPGYHDVWGHYNPLGEHSRRGLLAAMGLPVDDEAALRKALEEHERRAWLSPLPPVVVARPEALRIPLSLPEAALGQPVLWQLTEESGSRHRGTVRAEQLEHLDRREIDGITYHRLQLELPPLPCGYHYLELTAAAMPLIVVPEHCQPLPAGKHWGLAIQLYAVRSGNNWGIGDFADLQTVIEFSARLGATTIGLNPLHALFPDQPQRCSPYSPSNRRFVNPLYLAIESMVDFAECISAREQVATPEFQAELQRLRLTERVDYSGVAAVKYPLLQTLYRHFRERHLTRNSERAHAFRRYLTEQGDSLRRQAVFETLNRWFRSLDPTVSGWHDWLPGFRHPDAEPVARQAEQQTETVEFFQYLQWQCDTQLQQMTETARRCGLRLGLYQDLAVGADSAGGEVWADRDSFARGARIGAPPDDFSPGGQDWGLPPPNPRTLHETAYRSFITTLQAVMRHAGVLRIDHVMALLRLFWIPPDGRPGDGAYVHYPLADLLSILALESMRNHCVIIGEALGTVPDEVRTALDRAGVYSYRPLYFEKHWDSGGRFKAPEDYPEQALIAATTHDLPTLAGFWLERDIDWREQLDLFPRPGMAEQERGNRVEDRQRLLAALEAQCLRPPSSSANGPFSPELMLAIQQFLARSPARLLMVQIEDLLGQVEQVNLPGTVDQHANWCRKLAIPLENWAEQSVFQELAGRLRAEHRCDHPI